VSATAASIAAFTYPLHPLWHPYKLWKPPASTAGTLSHLVASATEACFLRYSPYVG
jgi:hypothetical protein